MCCKFSISPLTEFVGPTGRRDTQHGGLDFWLDKEMWSFEAVGRCFHGWKTYLPNGQKKTATVSCEFETNNDIWSCCSLSKMKVHILRQFMTKRSGVIFGPKFPPFLNMFCHSTSPPVAVEPTWRSVPLSLMDVPSTETSRAVGDAS